MFNRRLLVFAGLVILVVVALGALAWFIGPRLGWGPMAVGHGMWSDTRSAMRPGRHGVEGIMPHADFGQMYFGWGGLLAFGVVRFLGWLLQIGVIVAIVTWLLRRNAPPASPVQPNPSVSPGEPGTPTQA